MSYALVLAAVTNTALSHEEDCRCDACKAASGDKAALARVFASLPVVAQEGTE